MREGRAAQNEREVNGREVGWSGERESDRANRGKVRQVEKGDQWRSNWVITCG